MNMSLATLTGDPSHEHEPFQFWDTADETAIGELPDVPRDVSAPVDHPQENLTEEPPIDPALLPQPDAETRGNAAPQAPTLQHPTILDSNPSHTLETQSESSAGPIRHKRGQSSFSSTAGDPASEDANPATADQESKSSEDAPSSPPERYPTVPKADYVVKGGVRLTSTGKPSHARKVPANHIKRPRNAFILFRSHACLSDLIPKELNITDHRHISRVVGNLWKGLPPEEKRIWEEMAENEKEEHRRLNPDYKYRPVYRRAGTVRKRRRRPQEEEEVAEEERKCEVVARVLLEGGEVVPEKLEEEVQAQRQKDEQEGRKRGVSKTRSLARRARSHSQAYGEFIEHDMGHQFGYSNYGKGPIYENTRSRCGNTQRHNVQVTDQTHYMSVDQQYYDSEVQDPAYSAYPWELEMPPPLFPASRSRQGVPAPLSLQHPSNADLRVPATPRTLAMQQYQDQLNNKMRNEHNAGFLSPSAAAFGMRSPGNMGMSPKDHFSGRRERGVSFDASLLENMHLHGNSVAPADPNDLAAFQLGQGEQSYFQPSDDATCAFDNSTLNAMLQNENGAQPYSAFGEMAAASATAATGDRRNEISFQPEQEVQYVYLTREQAHDTALVESLRQAGWGISFDATDEEILTGALVGQ